MLSSINGSRLSLVVKMNNFADLKKEIEKAYQGLIDNANLLNKLHKAFDELEVKS